ncbi:MAG: phenylalanine--tRNA ligase subunit beta [Flavobacteriaceae bacterium]|nr:phenylalanine--tRNA ligase subunit beta [Flavobacteriaceae bacterium]
MNISFNWLNEFLKINLKIDEVCEILTDIGLEVEGVVDYQDVKGDFEGLIVGEVIHCEKHPNADRLKLTKVNIGQETLQIVCGAPNVNVNQKVIVATVGTTIYPTSGEKFKINKSKIRGEISFGMICAENEIGLGNSHDGIMILEKSIKVGTQVCELFENYNDQVINIGLTPNRSDAMSHMGVARDLRAALIQKGIKSELITPSVSSFHINSRTQKANVYVEDSKMCPRFSGVCIDNIIVKDSPKWLQNKLKAIGIVPINNVVDITNYVLHESGNPLHAYDLDKISTKSIHVKTLKNNSNFTTLDGKSRQLKDSDLMICDNDTPMCLAGIFGGSKHGISNDTSSIFLECAYFNPVTIRKSAKHHGLNTDASFRFERGTSIENIEYALKRAAILICELCDGKISSDIIDEYPKKPDEVSILLNFEKTNRLIGQEIPREEIKSILTSLDFKINNITETGVGITVPFYRHDIYRECDVVEEILRIYGYNKINLSNKLSIPINIGNENLSFKIEKSIAQSLLPLGFNEIMNNSLTNNQLNLFNRKDVKILNSLSKDVSKLRTTLLESSLKTLKYNINRKNNNLKYFEFGKIYESIKDSYNENRRLSITYSGKIISKSWRNEFINAEFYSLKNIVINILSKLSIEVNEEPIELNGFKKTLGLFNKDKKLAIIGLVDKNTCGQFDIKQDVFYASIDIDLVHKNLNTNFQKYKPLSKFQPVQKDMSFIIDKKIEYSQIKDLLMKSHIKNLINMNLFDVYEGDKIGKNKKSYALNFTLSNSEKTLNEKEIHLAMNKIQNKLKNNFNALLRDK